MASGDYILDIDGNGTQYISNNSNNYKFEIDKFYMGEREFNAITYGEHKPVPNIKGAIEFCVKEMSMKEIYFNMWFTPNKTQHGVQEVTFQTNILKALGTTRLFTKEHRDKFPLFASTYNYFFHLLDNIGERWDRYMYVPVAKATTKLTIVEDYFHKKCNLKGKVILNIEKGLFSKRTEEGGKGEEYVYCRFEEDIGGSNLDGKSSKRNYLFLPKKLVVPMTESESKKKKNKEEVLQVLNI